MPKLIVNYMRPMAVVLFILATVVITVSYFFIPKVYAIVLTEFYRQYWHLLTFLFLIAVLFLGLAFYLEHGLSSATRWIQHCAALILIGLFVRVVFMLTHIVERFFAFI